MQLRKLVTSDYESFLAMRLKMLESSSENYSAGLSDWQNASQEQIMAFLKEGEDASDNFVLGAFSQENLNGMAGFRRETRASLRHKGNTWGLYQISGSDAEELLLREIIRIVSAYPEFKYIRSVQNASNAEKLELFHRVGFRQYGLEEKSLKIGERFFDHVYLKLELNS